MAKKPIRTWLMLLSLGIPLVVVVIAAMLASFTALYDVAAVNGVVIPALLPVVVDVGMIASNAATVYFRRLGVKGRWVADVIFVGFAAVSVYANITHAWLAADLTRTSLVTAVIIAAIFPAGQLGVTHMVMMLIPDEKERVKLQAQRERIDAQPVARAEPKPEPVQLASRPVQPVLAAPMHIGSARDTVPEPLNADTPTAGAPNALDGNDEARAKVIAFIEAEGKRPTGSMVSEWRGGGDRRTGTRFIQRMEADGLIPPVDQTAPVLVGATS